MGRVNPIFIFYSFGESHPMSARSQRDRSLNRTVFRWSNSRRSYRRRTMRSRRRYQQSERYLHTKDKSRGLRKSSERNDRLHFRTRPREFTDFNPQHAEVPGAVLLSTRNVDGARRFKSTVDGKGTGSRGYRGGERKRETVEEYASR